MSLYKKLDGESQAIILKLCERLAHVDVDELTVRVLYEIHKNGRFRIFGSQWYFLLTSKVL